MQNPSAAGISRRQFIYSSATALAAPLMLPSRIFGREAPSRTLQVGIVGCGNRSRGHIPTFSAIPGVRMVAVCDIWSKRAQDAKTRVDELNGDTGCKTYHDFRELIADSEVDIVVVAAPDHWHSLVAIEAANHGKHLYLEKPFAYSIEEGRAVTEAVTRNGVILQHGTQQRSISYYQRGTYLAKHGYLGNVDTVYAISPTGPSGGDPSKRAIPEGYDYDFFTGPAPKTPFYVDLAYRQGTPGWYFTSVFGGGWITAWGSHHVDSAQFALGKDHEAPVSVEATGKYPETGMFDTAHSWYAEFKYADGKKLIYCTSDRPECPKVGGKNPWPRFHGMIVMGDRGWAAVSRQGMRTHPAHLVETAWPLDDPALQLVDRGNVGDHVKNLIDAIRYGTRLNAPMEVGHLSTTLCHLTSIGIETQRPLAWDAKSETIVNDAMANRLLGRPMRAPWTLT